MTKKNDMAENINEPEYSSKKRTTESSDNYGPIMISCTLLSMIKFLGPMWDSKCQVQN